MVVGWEHSTGKGSLLPEPLTDGRLGGYPPYEHKWEFIKNATSFYPHDTANPVSSDSEDRGSLKLLCPPRAAWPFVCWGVGEKARSDDCQSPRHGKTQYSADCSWL
jgi:hypothetical protein